MITVLFHTLLNAALQGAEPAAPDFQAFVAWALSTVLTLGGFAALLTFLVNAGKQFNIVQDGWAPKIVAGGNLLVFVALIALKIFRPDSVAQYLGIFDQTSAALAQVGTIILGFLLQMGVSRRTHAEVKGFPLIGTSLTLKSLQGSAAPPAPIDKK